MYSLGVDLAEPTTSWTRTSVGAAWADTDGSVSAVVGVGDSGALVIAPPGAEATAAAGDVVTGFLSSLGSSEPVMVGGTPYGVEALVACLLSEVVAVNTQVVGSAPDLVVLVHDDDLDAYRASMLHEAARIAGVAPGRLLLVTRSAAAGAAGPTATVAAGAARLGSDTLSEAPSVPDGEGGDVAAGGGIVVGGAAGVAGAIGLGGTLAEGGAVSAAGATGADTAALGAGSSAAGPAGSSVGPAGSSVGPTGSSVGPGGAGGVAGPSGSGPVGVGGSGTIGSSVSSSAFPWIPVAVGGAIALVVAVIAVAVIAGGGDPPPEEAAAVTAVVPVVQTSVLTQPSSTASDTTTPVSTDVATTAETQSSTTLDPDIDLAAYVGDWVACAPSPDAPNVSAAVEYSFTPAGPNQLTLEYVVLVYTDSSDCSGTGLPSNSATYTASVVGETVIDGVPAVQVTTEENSFVMGVVGDTLQYGASTSPGSFPTAFDPTAVYSRRS